MNKITQVPSVTYKATEKQARGTNILREKNLQVNHNLTVQPQLQCNWLYNAVITILRKKVVPELIAEKFSSG